MRRYTQVLFSLRRCTSRTACKCIGGQFGRAEDQGSYSSGKMTHRKPSNGGRRAVFEIVPTESPHTCMTGPHEKEPRGTTYLRPYWVMATSPHTSGTDTASPKGPATSFERRGRASSLRLLCCVGTISVLGNRIPCSLEHGDGDVHWSKPVCCRSRPRPLGAVLLRNSFDRCELRTCP